MCRVVYNTRRARENIADRRVCFFRLPAVPKSCPRCARERNAKVGADMLMYLRVYKHARIWNAQRVRRVCIANLRWDCFTASLLAYYSCFFAVGVYVCCVTIPIHACTFWSLWAQGSSSISRVLHTDVLMCIASLMQDWWNCTFACKI